MLLSNRSRPVREIRAIYSNDVRAHGSMFVTLSPIDWENWREHGSVPGSDARYDQGGHSPDWRFKRLV